MLPLLWCFFTHLLILQYPDHHQNLISSFLYYSGPLHKISSQSVHNFLSNVVHRQTDKLTNQRYQKHNLLCQRGNNRLTDPTAMVILLVTSFANEVMFLVALVSYSLSVCLFVCGQHYSKSYERIGMKFYGGVQSSTRKN